MRSLMWDPEALRAGREGQPLNCKTGTRPVSISHSQILVTRAKAKEKQSSRLGQGSELPCPQEGEEQWAAPTRLCGLEHEVSVRIQVQKLAELLHIFRAVLGLHHHHVPSTVPGGAVGPAECSHGAGHGHSTIIQHPHQDRGHSSAKLQCPQCCAL